MKYSKFTLILVFFLAVQMVHGQKEIDFTRYSFTFNSLENADFEQLMNQKLQNSRFVFVGEQHGIKSAATVTERLFSLGQPVGYNTLCVETDELAAQQLKSITATSDFTKAMKAHYEEYPFTIPFYNNEDDHVLFDRVHQAGGDFWGIDQTFVVQFRYNLDYLAKKGSNPALKTLATELKTKADAAYATAIETKNPSAPYIFQYEEATHKKLKAAAQTAEEKEIVYQLWKTKEISSYYFQGKGYQNNNVRGQLMKANFMRYWNAALASRKDPKVIFKLGAFHAARGLTDTNIYDIANLGSELAISQGERSVHVAVLGLKGKAATGNPFAPGPEVEFDNTDQLPEEIKTLVANMTDKYFLINLEPLRDFGYGKRLSDDMKKTVFQYDVLILVNGAEALRSF